MRRHRITRARGAAGIKRRVIAALKLVVVVVVPPVPASPSHTRRRSVLWKHLTGRFDRGGSRSARKLRTGASRARVCPLPLLLPRRPFLIHSFSSHYRLTSVPSADYRGVSVRSCSDPVVTSLLTNRFRLSVCLACILCAYVCAQFFLS